jgi:signal transduction histidine kinase
MTTIRDMSNWIELERQKNLSAMKTLAFDSAAHEFRNPLHALSMTLEMIKPHVIEDRGRKYCQIAKNCSNLMLFLVKDIMDFS